MANHVNLTLIYNKTNIKMRPDINQKDTDNRIYKAAYNYLLGFEKKGVTADVINKYLHFSETKPRQTRINGIYSRLLESAQNGSMKSKVIGDSIDGFKNIGKILVASFDHRLQAQIQTELKAEPEREQEVVSSLLGCSYQRFGESVLQEWKIPDVIIQSLHALSAGELKKATHRSEWLRQVVSFSDEVAALLVHSDLKEKTAQSMIERCAPLLRRYGKCLEINQATLEEMLRRVDNETRQLADSMDIAVNEPWTDLDLELGLGDAGAQLGNEFTCRALPRMPCSRRSVIPVASRSMRATVCWLACRM